MSHTHSPHTYPGWGWMLPIWIVLITLLMSACAVRQPRVYHVGILAGLGYFNEAIDGFKERMSELGYIEGQTIQYDIHYTDVDLNEYDRILDQFVANNVDLIFVFPTEATLVAKTATQGTAIPVVFSFTFTEGVDLIDHVNAPGGNMTGVRFPGPEVALKRFEIMHELVPQARYIGIPYQRDAPTVASQLAVLYPAAAAASVTLIELPAANADELAAALQAHADKTEAHMDAIIFLAEPFSITPDAFAVATRFAAEHQIPIGGSLMTVDGYGSIFGITSNNFVAGNQAAVLVDKVLSGTPAGSIPAVASQVQLRINYTVAQQLGITVPNGLLHQADEVIR